MNELEGIKRAYGYGCGLDVNTYPHWLISRVQELENKNKRYREALEEIKEEETITTALSEGQVAYTVSGHIAWKSLEGDNDE